MSGRGGWKKSVNEEGGGGKELNECIVEEELGGCVEYGESVQGSTCVDLH